MASPAARALALHQAGQLAEAAPHYEKALRARPRDAGLLAHCGALRVQLGEAAAGAALLRKALGLAPGDSQARFNLGVALLKLGQAGAAAAAFAAVTAAEPANAAAWRSLGHAERDAGRLPPAIAAYRRSLALAPDHAPTLGNLGGLLNRAMRSAEAEAVLRRAIALAPQEPRHANNLGVALQEMAREAEAEAAFRTALALAPGHQSTLENLGGLLARRRPAEAAPLLAQALAQLEAAGQPPDAWLLGNLLHARARLCQWEGRDALLARMLAAPGQPAEPMTLLWHADAPAAHRRLAEARAAALAQGLPAPALRRAVAGPGPLRLGYLSPDFGVLIDLAGWTTHGRPDVLALRPAPVQAAWLGYPGTTGAPWIDYAIVDPVVAPPGAEAGFTEALVRLPHCYQPNDRRRAVAVAPGRAAAGLPEAGLVLCCFCQPGKITPKVFAAWLRILAGLGDAVLWLLDHGAAANAALRAAAGGLAGRLVFAPFLPMDGHLARYRLADLALDSFPYGSHTTASDALWAGCPQLALTGEGFAARVSTSILHAAGLAELAAPDLPGFEALALRLGRDPAARAALRARVAAARGSALFDAGGFAGHLEAACRAMLERARAGLPPASIDIPA